MARAGPVSDRNIGEYKQYIRRRTMEDLTFGEQVKIILGRKGMTIKQLAELIEVRTGKKMSRQNLTQRLGRDNFQEQDMRMIAAILDCPFHLSIMSEAPVQPRSTAALEKAAIARTDAVEKKQAEEEMRTEEIQTEETQQKNPGAPEAEERERTAESAVQNTAEPVAAENSPEVETSGDDIAPDERDMTIGELYEIHEELSELEENAKAGEPVEEIKKELEKPKKSLFHTGGIFLRRKQREAATADETKPAEKASEDAADENASWSANGGQPEQEKMQPAAEQHSSESAAAEKDDFEPVISHDDVEEDREVGEVNPYTGREYQSNSVRMHPTRIGYVQVYDRTIHKWTDMTEWAFLGLQERKKALLGKAYEPPIYLD